MDLDKTIEKRASIRSYTPKKPDIDEVLELIHAASLAPSPGNLSILRYIIVEDPDKIKKISEAAQQNFISKAKILLVLTSYSKQCDLMYDKRSQTYIKQHAGAAIENLLLKVTDLGLATCWVGAFIERQVKEILSIPDDDENQVQAIFPIGYPMKFKNNKQKRKPSIFGKVYYESFGNTNKEPYRDVRRENI